MAFFLAGWYLFLAENSLWEQYRRRESQVVVRRDVYRKMRRLNRQYRVTRKRAEGIISRLGSRPEGWTVEGFIEKTVHEFAPGATLKRMKPSSETVHDLYRKSSAWVNLGRISLPELVDFLYGVEYGETPLQIRELKIEDEKKSPGLLEVELTVVTAEPLVTPPVIKAEPSPPPPPEIKKQPKLQNIIKKNLKEQKAARMRAKKIKKQ